MLFFGGLGLQGLRLVGLEGFEVGGLGCKGNSLPKPPK